MKGKANALLCYCDVVQRGQSGHNETADDCLLNPSPAERVCYSVQLPTSAVNVTLLAFTAEHRPFSKFDRWISWPPGAQQQTRRSGVWRSNDWTQGRLRHINDGANAP